MPASGPLSMSDGLATMLQTVGRMFLDPSADQSQLMDLQHILIAMGQHSQGAADAASNPQAGAGGGPPVAGPGGPPPGNPPDQAQGAAGAGQPPAPGQNQLSGNPNASAGMARPKPPDPDELRRFLESRAGR